MDKRAKRICMLADTHGLYDDRIYWKEALSLSRAGYQVYYLLASDIDESGITAEGIHYIKIKRKVYSKNRYLNYLVKLFIYCGLYCRMYRAAKSLNADVYHIHDLKVNRIGPKLKKQSWKPKVVYDVHEPYPENIVDYHPFKGFAGILIKKYSDYIRMWENRCAMKYDMVITTEENVKERFGKVISENKVKIIYNYTNLLDVKTGNEQNEKQWDAIYTGGITKLRGAMKILEAMKLAVKEKPNLKLLFLGTCFPPGLKQEMQDYLEINRLEGNVDLFDSVPYPEVAGFYKRSRIGLGIFLPNPTHRIILQIKIFEYFSFGLPIIGSNFGHINNYICGNNAGIAVDPENETEIANGILTLVKDNDLYAFLSNNALKASEKYQWHLMEEKLVRIYGNLLMKKQDKK